MSTPIEVQSGSAVVFVGHRGIWETQGSIPINNKQDIRTALKRAVNYLVARYHCTPQEARRRIYQRARAKKAELGHVARMIVAGQAVDYHYNAPPRRA
jgi:hypothetical protein